MLFKLFDPLFLRKLQLIHFKSKKASLKSSLGDLLAQRGSSLEFLEYREYAFGDEFKYIDWNIYGRLEKFYVKLFKGEKNLAVTIVLDASKSMGFPRKDKKFVFAVKCAVALAYIALSNKNKVKVVVIAGKNSQREINIISETPFFGNLGRIHTIAAFLMDFKPSGVTDFGESLRKTIVRNRDTGTVFVVSDFLVESHLYRGLVSFFKSRNFDTNIFHLRGYTEIHPSDKIGKIKVRDTETGMEKVVLLSSSNRRKLIDEFARHQEDLKRFCIVKGVNYVFAETNRKAEDFLLTELPRLRVLR
jgi:hypothetical protein